MPQSEQFGPAANPIDIVITSYYRPQFTWECLNAIETFTTTSHRVIVIDNGSDKSTQDTLWDAKEEGLIDILILLDKNYGLEPAKNYALSYVSSDIYVDSDNDILVPPSSDNSDWLGRLSTLLEKDDKLVAVATTPQVFIGAHKEEIFKDADEVVERDYVGASMRLMRTDAVRSAGGWRSNPKDMNEANRGEEKYICGKLRAKGYKVGYARDIGSFHCFGEENWGYPDNVDHYHRDMWPLPTDKLYGNKKDWYEKHG